MRAQSWHTTTDTHTAAASASLGAEVRIESALHSRTSTREVRFLIAPQTQDRAYTMGKIFKSVRDQSLLQRNPGHDYLTFLRAYLCRQNILDMSHKGSRWRLVPVTGAPGIHQLMPGNEGLPGIPAGASIVRTEDLKMAAALVLAGFPILRITGSAGSYEWTHAAFHGPQHIGLNAAQLISEWRRDTQALPWELPFTKAAHALTVLEKLQHEVRRAKDTIILSKPRTTAHATIHQDASKSAWDKASRFFSGISS